VQPNGKLYNTIKKPLKHKEKQGKTTTASTPANTLNSRPVHARNFTSRSTTMFMTLNND